MDDGSGHVDSFLEVVGKFIDARRLIPPGEGVVVGVSGGADSVTLLAVLRELAVGRGYKLTAAHMNHCLRDSADADERFVAELAQSWDIPCILERCDVAAEAKQSGKGIEQAARTVRYRFLQATAEQVGAKFVAVGHHANDNVETVLYRIIRGTHLRGLAGIPASRRLGGSEIMLVRPLLTCSREAIEAYCRRADLRWRNDETNLETGYRRNFIRHELLPLLRERLNPRADEALIRLTEAAGEVNEFLKSHAKAALARARRETEGQRIVLDPAALADEPAAVIAYAMRAALEDICVGMGAMNWWLFCELSKLVTSKNAAAVALPGGFVARREHGEVVIEPGCAMPERETVPVKLTCPGRTVLSDGRQIICRIMPFDADSFTEHCRKKNQGVEMVDADKLQGGLIVRTRRDGDAFTPLGVEGTQKVGDFLTNQKTPRRRREEVMCVCDELGLVYLAPLRIDARVKVTSKTARVLRIEIVGGGMLDRERDER